MKKFFWVLMIAACACGCNKRETESTAPVVEPSQTPAEKPWLQNAEPQATPRAATPDKPYAFSLTGMPALPPFVGDTLTTGELKAYSGQRGVATLNWKTESEKGTFGFYIVRGDSPGGPFKRVNADLPVSAAGDSSVARYYAYYDTSVIVGKTYYYKLEEILMSGKVEQLIEKPARLIVRSRFIDGSSTGTQTNGAVARPR
ncbi:hypothetical protein LLG95_17240 [bacterium]|nr:hypothetical protein [bacterium]